MNTKAILATALSSLLTMQIVAGYSQGAFPYDMPKEKPTDRKLSRAMERLYDDYKVITPQRNELYSVFKFSNLTGLDYNNDDGTITRRDPTRVIKVGDTYYMWYTLRNTKITYQGADKCTDEIPSVDWDLCDIGYATSKDGFEWKEQGVAVPRPPKPTLGWRSISTPEILVWKGKYYLYFQAFSQASGTDGGDNCPVAMAEADSPDGPWRYIENEVIPNGKKGEWDQHSIHDPLPVVLNGKIYMYYKSDFNGKPDMMRAQGLAIGDNPRGPFVKYECNPVINSGHETQFFRFKEGVAALATRDGHEHYTVQYADDGKNFEIASITGLMPDASGLCDPDAFTDTKYARGITWGVCHYCIWGEHRRTILLRFDCDLSLDLNDPDMKRNNVRPSLDDFLTRRLTAKQRQRILEEMKN
ncbi:MAG: family 43 glycosylhydrolase [Rikenellaceae bacterium]